MDGAVGEKGSASKQEWDCTVLHRGLFTAKRSLCCAGAQTRFAAGAHVTIALGSRDLSACTTVTALALFMLPPPFGDPPAQPAAL